MNTIFNHDHFALANFEGPLDFLLYLIQKDEVDIFEIPIQELIHQFVQQDKEFEKGAEFIGIAAYLVWLKSKTLLPQQESPSNVEEEVEDPRFEIIHHLIDYCRFKQAGKDLALLQEKQQACYFRGTDVPDWKKPLGIDHISLEELSQLFKTMMSRAAQLPEQIQEENWRVSDKIRFIRQRLEKQSSFPLTLLLSAQQSRLEMIVIFLAILELMKNGELGVGREEISATLLIFSKKE